MHQQLVSIVLVAVLISLFLLKHFITCLDPFLDYTKYQHGMKCILYVGDGSMGAMGAFPHKL